MQKSRPRWTRTKSRRHSTAMPLPIASQKVVQCVVRPFPPPRFPPPTTSSSTRKNIGNETRK
eukprot:31074-Pelagococcus_subviridis.AAC.13